MIIKILEIIFLNICQHIFSTGVQSYSVCGSNSGAPDHKYGAISSNPSTVKEKEQRKKFNLSWALVAHTYNPSYLRG
jgi:hypothetical protein